ncbi:adenylate/guanylate cyclase domain-containing response regulator [Sphingobacterium siyangense]|uniref:adenylate/guanylate cyclase domain-containing response regulator n=1 Tax=Sphingobacterium siyangense TaxID=459529 RepID=UPI002FDD415C
MAKILIVDDEKPNSDAYKRALELDSSLYEISTAANEHEAEVLISKENFDVVITDLAMIDDQSGMRVLNFSKEKQPLTMVIMVTAYADKMDRYAAFENGAFDCIAKSTPGLKTTDEIIAKTKTALYFREMIESQIESQKKVAVLKRYFDPKVFSQLDNHDVLALKSKTITIVFWDIRGFSKACEILKAVPEAIAKFLKAYFDLASKIIFKHGGVLDKFIGDGIMALFGSLNENESSDDASSAAKAAIDLKSEFEVLLEQWIVEWSLYTPEIIKIGLGSGMHTGECLVGSVGTEIRDQYTALGSAVNLAARIESRTIDKQILVSQTTYARLAKSFHFKDAGIINDIKNIPGDFQIYELIEEIK